jgi:hypothetical protein
MHAFNGIIPKRVLITTLLGLPLCVVRVKSLGRTFLSFLLRVVDDTYYGNGNAGRLKTAEDLAAESVLGKLRTQWDYLWQ